MSGGLSHCRPLIIVDQVPPESIRAAAQDIACDASAATLLAEALSFVGFDLGRVVASWSGADARAHAVVRYCLYETVDVVKALGLDERRELRLALFS